MTVLCTAIVHVIGGEYVGFESVSAVVALDLLFWSVSWWFVVEGAGLWFAAMCSVLVGVVPGF